MYCISRASKDSGTTPRPTTLTTTRAEITATSSQENTAKPATTIKTDSIMTATTTQRIMGRAMNKHQLKENKKLPYPQHQVVYKVRNLLCLYCYCLFQHEDFLGNSWCYDTVRIIIEIQNFTKYMKIGF